MYSNTYLLSTFKCPMSMKAKGLCPDSACLLCPQVPTRVLLPGWRSGVSKFRNPWVDRLVIKWFPHSWVSIFVPKISVQDLIRNQTNTKFPTGWHDSFLEIIWGLIVSFLQIFISFDVFRLWNLVNSDVRITLSWVFFFLYLITIILDIWIVIWLKKDSYPRDLGGRTL